MSVREPLLARPTEALHRRIDLVGSYFTDLADMRDRILGPRSEDFSPATVADRAEQWLRRHTFRTGVEGLQDAAVSTPLQLRTMLIGVASAHDPRMAERVTFATELLALGTAIHDSVGPERPRAPVSDRQLVLVGDVLLSRAVTHITRGGPELAWFIDHAFERLVVNQHRYSAEPGNGSISSWEAATREGAGLLTYAAVRCCALQGGDGEGGADSAGRAATELAIAVQLCFDMHHLTRPVPGGVEVNSRSAMFLAAAGLNDLPADSVGSELLARAMDPSVRIAAVDRARVFVERARAEITRGSTRLEPVLTAAANCAARAVLRAAMHPSVGAGVRR